MATQEVVQVRVTEAIDLYLLGTSLTKICRKLAPVYNVTEMQVWRYLQKGIKQLEPASIEKAHHKIAFHEEQVKQELEYINKKLRLEIGINFEDRTELINLKLKCLAHLAKVNGLDKIAIVYPDETQALEAGIELLKKIREIDFEEVKPDEYGT